MAAQATFRTRRQSGQALFMVTFAMFALCGMMGLAVDLGWSFFVKKAAQSAADAAALAAAREALRIGVGSGFTCGSVTGIACAASAVECGSVLSDTATYSNLANGCTYASNNGFTTNGHANRQSVTIQANDNTTLPPTAPGVNDIRYWVTVSVTETVPQLFSTVLGNPNGQVNARATAGVVQVLTPGSFYALNREGDCMGTQNCGVDVKLAGNGTLQAPRGLVMASNCSGQNNAAGCGSMAGIHNGQASVVNTPSIQIRGAGTADSNTAFPGWVNGGSGDTYVDPTKGRAQPPIVTTNPIKTCGVVNGQINQSGTTPVVLGPYNYYAYRLNGASIVPTSDPITLNGTDIRFSPSGTCPGVLSTTGATQSGDFPAYFLHGGLVVTNSSNVTFGSGQYVIDGALPGNGGRAGVAFDTGGGNATLATAAGASNMFIVTAPGSNAYPGLNTQLNIPEIATAASRLYQGSIGIKAGNSAALQLHGYEKGDGPTTLDDYNGILVWQDRRNSTIKYNADGTYNCAGPSYTTGCQKTSTELDADRVIVNNNNDSRNMVVDATVSFGTGLDGVLYQPRGAWLSMTGNGNVNGGLQVVTGALNIQGGGNVVLNQPGNPLLNTVVALIE